MGNVLINYLSRTFNEKMSVLQLICGGFMYMMLIVHQIQISHKMFSELLVVICAYVMAHNRDDNAFFKDAREIKFRLHNESDSDVDVEIDEESNPIDDEKVDNFGEPFEAHESSSYKGSGSFVKNDLAGEDFTKLALLVATA